MTTFERNDRAVLVVLDRVHEVLLRVVEVCLLQLVYLSGLVVFRLELLVIEHQFV